MALLELKNLGKIYTSKGVVSIGIRGVDLSFNKGEFVAITGRSGGGKTSLLNMIGAVDSYQEGELFIEGEGTGHYSEKEWAEYRRRYVSYIFQDSAIIESFSVLQNVEIALGNLQDPKERRARAIELVRMVGMEEMIHRPGSKLSGGQRQRVAIARALAKDSPILLADEPTGNLDSKAAKEVMKLLGTLCKDKLVIVVTHNYQQIEQYCTRVVRIYDGTVESDVHIVPQPHCDGAKTPLIKRNTIKNGFRLGCTKFFSMPRLSVFLCLLMAVATIGMFLIMALCSSDIKVETNYVFRNILGRVVVSPNEEVNISEEKLSELVEATGAKRSLHYDIMLDTDVSLKNVGDCRVEMPDVIEVDVGRAPVGRLEVALYLPAYLAEYDLLNKKMSQLNDEVFSVVDMTIVGINYYYDNTIQPRVIVDQQGFEYITTAYYLYTHKDTFNANFQFYGRYKSAVLDDGLYVLARAIDNFVVLEDVQGREIGISKKWYDALGEKYKDIYVKIPIAMTKNEGYAKGGYLEFDPTIYVHDGVEERANKVVIGPEFITEIAYANMGYLYRQASLFYETEEDVAQAVKVLSSMGFSAISADTYSKNADEGLSQYLSRLTAAGILVVSVIFLILFVYLCSMHTVNTTKGELAIFRSMGVPDKEIGISVFVQMFMALAPSPILLAATAFVIYRTPQLNAYFTYLHFWGYTAVIVGMIVVVATVSRKFVKKLFRTELQTGLREVNRK